MKKIISLCLLIAIHFLFSCKKDDAKPSTPIITSFSPTSGPAGTNVIISGSNFSKTASDNIIKFNGIAASVISSTSGQIKTTVPPNATTGKISVTINTLTGSSASDFTVISTPTIVSFTPSSGVIGSTVTIVGTNFSSTPTSNLVKFNGVSATVTSASSTQIGTTVPNGSTSGKITVSVNGVIASSATDFSLIPTATITDFSPSSGPVGTSVTIAGANFSATASNNVVKFNGVVANVNSATVSQLVATVPAGATTGTITIEVNGQLLSSSTNFTVLPIPTISDFSPASAITRSIIAITGNNFGNDINNITVSINGVSATVVSVSSSNVVIMVPNGASTGKISVTVSGVTGQSTSDFSVISFSCASVYTDLRDNKTYTTATIGSDCWMTTNLKHGTFVTTSTGQTNNNVIEKYGYNDGDDTDSYGGIYLWDELMQYTTAESTQGTCPAGWHVPSDTEWKNLELALGMTAVQVDSEGWRGTDQGTQLRNTYGCWHAGYFANPTFQLRGNSELYWTSSQKDASTSWHREIYDGSPLVNRSGEPTTRGLYVRCIRNQ